MDDEAQSGGGHTNSSMTLNKLQARVVAALSIPAVSVASL